MRSLYVRFGFAFAVGLAASFMVAHVHAAIIDLGTGSAITAGTMTIAGPNISGSGIPLDALGINGAPVNNGSYDTSGAFVSAVDPDDGTSAVLSFDTATNFIKVIGGIPALGIAAGTTLLQGTIAAFDLQTVANLLAFSASGPDAKSPLLLSAIGLPASTSFEFFTFSIGALSNGGKTATAFSVDLGNASVPEPSSVLLLGTGLLGFAWMRRKRAQEVQA